MKKKEAKVKLSRSQVAQRVLKDARYIEIDERSKKTSKGYVNDICKMIKENFSKFLDESQFESQSKSYLLNQTRSNILDLITLFDVYVPTIDESCCQCMKCGCVMDIGRSHIQACKCKNCNNVIESRSVTMCK